jgi:hypothetical protein
LPSLCIVFPFPSVSYPPANIGSFYCPPPPDLQEYLLKYPSSHYSKDGKEPLLYATVLLLSLQFRQAITYLTKVPTIAAPVSLPPAALVAVPTCESPLLLFFCSSCLAVSGGDSSELQDRRAAYSCISGAPRPGRRWWGL